MAQVSLQYETASAISRVHEECFKLLANDHTSLADLDDSETLYTADITLTGDDQGLMFLVTTTADTTAGHTIALTLMTGSTHARAVTNGLIRADQSAPAIATTITLDMGTAADRNVIIHVNPAGVDSSLDPITSIVSLRAVGAGSLSNCVVRVSAITYALRTEK